MYVNTNLLIFMYINICNTISIFYVNEESFEKIGNDISILYKVIEIVFCIE